ncbi:hypothetical protein NHX12_017978 [Muraenolepis orangiensis]|uniref:SH3 domain-containing protein n=1 Tax=Muraenolepis orangiensis TaxID=630683 RepID=A0A9Q0EW55_9TELE|nr:hypothetical protein NHX12_017978 [Muraenolepis orangiensis]
MSEPRSEEQGEEMGDRAVRDPAIDCLQRTKPDHSHSRYTHPDFTHTSHNLSISTHKLSQRALSSIQAAIKQSRTNSPSDSGRERRRPEITILSAEPLANSSWFPGASGIFTSTPPSPAAPQSSWPGNAQADPQPPPSYDQVIKAKTQEEHVARPIAAPRKWACTSTSGTQTDPERDGAASAAPPLCPARGTGRKPNVTSSNDQEELSSNKYIEELLEVFGSDNSSFENSTAVKTKSTEQSTEADGEMSAIHSQRDLRARIAAFETGTEDKVKSLEQQHEEYNAQTPPVPAVKPLKEPLISLMTHFTEDEPYDRPLRDLQETMPSRVPVLPPSRSSIMAKVKSLEQQQENHSLAPPVPAVKPFKEPLIPNLNLNNHNSTFMATEDEYVNTPSIPAVKPFKEPLIPNLNLNNHNSTFMATEDEYVNTPSIPAVKPFKEPLIPNLNNHNSAFVVKEDQYDIPSTKAGPARPPPPCHDASGGGPPVPASQWGASRAAPTQKAKKNGPALPPRPSPGHRLYNKYTITNLASGAGGGGLQVQAIYDFSPEGPEEMGLKAGDVVNMVEQVDSDWYKGTCRGSTGFFPVSYVNVLSNSPLPLHEKKKKPPAMVSGPRCVARFDFEGEQDDELTFSEGDVISLIEYVGDDWAKGQLKQYTGVFPLNFVEVVEDLPPPPMQQQPQARAPQPSGPEWVVALYDFNGQPGEDLSFKQGDRILVTSHLDVEWWTGRLNGREGIFPRAFVQGSPGQSLHNNQQRIEPRTGKALFQFTAECEEELSLQAGDIITNLESADEEWFLGDLRGKRALVPKNFVEVLG